MHASQKDTSGIITASQVRAARGLLGWPLHPLIEASGVAKSTLIRFEAEAVVPRAATIDAIRTALEGAGVEFIPENGGGPGVRLKQASREPHGEASKSTPDRGICGTGE
jgi:transcriptional regulator with XRE-family HTH domain